MQKHPALTAARIKKFQDSDKLACLMYKDRKPVTLAAYAAPGRIDWAEAQRGTYKPVKPGHQFGPLWSTHWIQVHYAIPKAWRGREVHLLFDASAEACVWEDGVPVQGLTGSGHPAWTGAARPIRSEYRITRRARGGESGVIHLEVACNHLFGLDHNPGQIGILRQAEIAVFDPDAWALAWDFTVLAEMAEHLPPDSPRGAQARAAANAFLNDCDPAEPSTWPAALRPVRKFLAVPNGGGQHQVSCIGHAHIDTAWLWPLAETRRKCYRTFSTVLRYMEDYPEYKFACSQAQQYDWIRRGQPALYRKIRKQVRAGRFIPVGGTWIEPDCNLPSGESLVRQFLHGQRFFQREFGRICEEFWNPDVFGYNGQLPQIMRGAGIQRFLTQKLSWNQFNKPDSHTFWWEGIDGSRVLTHFPPTDTYNAVCTVKEMLFHVRNYKELDRSNESYCLFGFGDGGGGPTMGMLERLRRMKDSDGLPKTAIRGSRDFFGRLERDAHSLVTKTGELYLEVHRGTYTTQSQVKYWNRRNEELLRDVELLSCMAGAAYPQRDLDHLWKLLLLNQFHDIIPGSSIREVYEDASRDHAEIHGTGSALRSRALKRLAGRTGPRWLAINTLSTAREEVADLPGGKPAVVKAPALGYAVQKPGTAVDVPVRATAKAGGFELENASLRVRIDRAGRVASLVDKRRNFEVLAEGGHRYVLHDDQPTQYDAWDIEVFHLEKAEVQPAAEAVRLVEKGPLRATVEIKGRIGKASRMVQRISLTALSDRLEFACEVDWQEKQKLLKLEVPTVLRAEQATYEIQFGHVRRPTHFNSSQDMARFEVCAFRWADLRETGAGLVLMNDCKYGHSVHGSVMRLSLLRSPLYPDPKADRGLNRFRFAMLPHDGGLSPAAVTARAAAFNQPLLLVPTSLPEESRSWFRVDQPGVLVDTVKRAEDGQGLIVRLYEADGSHVRCTLSADRPLTGAVVCNLLEEGRESVPARGGGLALKFRPFEIKTLRLPLR